MTPGYIQSVVQGWLNLGYSLVPIVVAFIVFIITQWKKIRDAYSTLNGIHTAVNGQLAPCVKQAVREALDERSNTTGATPGDNSVVDNGVQKPNQPGT